MEDNNMPWNKVDTTRTWKKVEISMTTKTEPTGRLLPSANAMGDIRSCT